MSQIQTQQELFARIKELEIELRDIKSRKKYGLIWENKSEDVVLQCSENVPVLKESKTRKIITDHKLPNNLLIEGDNYHALSVLNYTHKGKIDVIYIDPPYNTGNQDFIYNDSFVDKEDGYRHSKWISFIEKRLKLAKDLLSESGVIFISIDDNEQSQLKLLCDSIFGERNFVGNLVWENKEGGGKSDSRFFRIKHEYVLVYGIDLTKLVISGLPIEDEERYRFSDQHEKTRGKYQLIKLDSASLGYVKSLDYPIISPDGSEIYPNKDGKKISRWRWGKQKLEWGLKNDFVVIKKDKKDIWTVYTKQYINCDNEGNLLERLIQPIGVIPKYSTTQSNSLLKDIFGEAIFNYSKPKELISYLLKISTNENSKILDFMAGSGTTGHAVLELNKEDHGNRQFILVTNNGDEKGEHKICEEVTYERVKRVIKGYKNKKGEKVEGLGGNLSYYKTDLVNIEKLYKVSDESRIKLTYQAGEMIAVREDTLNEVDKNDWWQIFEDRGKSTAIYFKEDKTKLSELITLLEKKKLPTVLYIFGWGKNEFRNEYSTKNIKIEDIPEPILEVYKEINRL